MKKSLVFKQSNSNDCGVCALASIIKYYGGIPNLEKLRELLHTTNQGTTAYNIIECASILGFKSNGLKLNNIYDLKKIVLPSIAHVVINNSYMHYIVIYNINYKNKTLTIMDPSIGIKKINFVEFNKIWTKVLLTFLPIKKIINLNKNNTFIKLIRTIIKEYKNIIMTIIILYLISFGISIFNSLYLKYLIDNIGIYKSDNFKKFSIILFFMIIFKIVFDYLRNYIVLYLNNKIDFSLNTTTFSHIIKLPYYYFKTKTTGDIISRIHDLKMITDGTINFIIELFINFLIFIISSFILYKISKYLFYILFIFTILMVVIEFIFIPLIKNNIDVVQNTNAITMSYLLESLNSFESIKSMNNHNYIIYSYENKLIEYLNNKLRFENIINRDNITKNLLYSLTLFTIIYLSYSQIISNKLTISSLIFFNSIYSYYIESIKKILILLPDIEYYSKTINRINDIFEIDTEKYFDKNKYINTKIVGDIKFINISYCINNTIEILKNVNLNIKRQSKIAIIGSTGSGKSSFLKLILRYYEISDGIILINNKNILDYNIDDLRNNICYISQNESLFTDTIYNNIVMNKNINYDYFLKICKLCEVDKIVNNKYLRYDYILEENGFNISGGERARIILARSLLKNSNIYIFDEALKEVDSPTERRILNNIFKEFSVCTFLIVTHKMDNLNMFDNILYVNNKTINYVTDL